MTANVTEGCVCVYVFWGRDEGGGELVVVEVGEFRDAVVGKRYPRPVCVLLPIRRAAVRPTGRFYAVERDGGEAKKTLPRRGETTRKRARRTFAAGRLGRAEGQVR